MRPKTLAIPSPIEITVPYSVISFNCEILEMDFLRISKLSPMLDFLFCKALDEWNEYYEAIGFNLDSL